MIDPGGLMDHAEQIADSRPVRLTDAAGAAIRRGISTAYYAMKDDLRDTPSDCFETFRFPAGWKTHPALEAANKAYYEYRTALMVENDEGMTRTYNRFHDIDETDPRIVELRELHAAMDRAVLDAYGWTDIPTHRLRLPPRLQNRRGYLEPQEEALPLPLAGHCAR